MVSICITVSGKNGEKEMTVQANTKRTVLVVDDDPFIQEVVRMMIETIGFEVIVAGDGNEALLLFDRHREDLFVVLCDLSMPGMDGWQTIAALHSRAPGFPVVLSSGHAIDNSITDKHAEKPWAVMAKPYVFATLKDILQQASGEDLPAA